MLDFGAPNWNKADLLALSGRLSEADSVWSLFLASSGAAVLFISVSSSSLRLEISLFLVINLV